MPFATMPEHALPRSADASAETDEWVDRVTRLAPLIEEHRDAADERRETSPAVMDALRAAGLHRMWVSTEFGGSRVAIPTGMAVIQALSRLDASLGWQIAVQGAAGRISDYLPAPTARELFKQDDGLVIGGINPAGEAEAVAGGYRVSGRWISASGYAHANWVQCTAFVTEGGRPRALPDGSREVRILYVPKSATRMHDSWHTTGLRGTGSNDFSVTPGTFVPDEYTVAAVELAAPPEPRLSRAYPISFYDFGPYATASVALGIAQDALASFKALALTKKPAFSSSNAGLAASHIVQDRVGRYEMLVRAAGLLLADAAREGAAHGEDGGDALTALIRSTAATVADSSVEVVNGFYRLAGSSSLFTASRLDRCFRDVNAVTKHFTISPMHFETAGRYLLGGPLLMRR